MRRLILFAVCIAITLPAVAHAQIQNGDFENGGTGWSTSTENQSWAINFPAAGGNPDGYAHIRSPFGNSVGESCISQVFDCTADGSGPYCNVCVDYRHSSLDASPMTGRVKIYMDGTLVFTSVPANSEDWTTTGFLVEPGSHEITLCLEVDPGNNGWEACFDNVTLDRDCGGPVSAEVSSWGAIRALYQD